MKILWIVNTVLPIIAKDRGIDCGVGGGWLTGISDALIRHEQIELVICFPYSIENISGNVNGINYYSFKNKSNYRYDDQTEELFIKIINYENPDIIHVFGTEFPHSFAAVNAAEKCGKLNKLAINIQGIIKYVARHYYAGLPDNVIHKKTIRDIVKRDNIYRQRKNFFKRAEFEERLLKKAKNVIGRTDWDMACAKYYNENVNYYFCNEILREDFYSGKWEYDLCEKHSIFIGSGSYPLKGFHRILNAMPLILKKYPDAKLYVTGADPLELKGIKNIIHKSYYQVYLRKLIIKHNLCGKVVFLGDLSSKQMKERMLKSNVFILASSIENSPNTLGEAMLLGVPCISSFVGGVPSMVTHKQEALLYPFEEDYLIPFYVGMIFDNIEFAETLSKNAKSKAEIIYSVDNNRLKLLQVYEEINKRG